MPDSLGLDFLQQISGVLLIVILIFCYSLQLISYKVPAIVVIVHFFVSSYFASRMIHLKN